MDTPQGQDYHGPSGIARESRWLTNEDVPHDKDTMVEIAAVILYRTLTMQGGREKKNALSLRFVGKGRELLLNATNRKTLATLFQTNECRQWYGKRVLLFVEQDVRRPDGTRGPAVRIRAKRVEQAEPANPPEDERVVGGDGDEGASDA